MKKRNLLIVTLVFFFVCLSFTLIACSSHGIPNGMYGSCDENGNISAEAPENCWQIKNNEAEYLYLKYKIIEVDGVVYFEYSSEETTIPDVQYKVEYNQETKILTVYMPSKEGAEGQSDGEEIMFRFKKTTLKELFS